MCDWKGKYIIINWSDGTSEKVYAKNKSHWADLYYLATGKKLKLKKVARARARASVQTCPKCGGYMQTIPVDVLSASLVHSIGRWRCNKCSYIPSLNTYDKKGVELTERMFDNSLHSKEKETKT